MKNSCPFSKAAYENDRVLEVVGGKKDLQRFVDNWDDKYQVIVLKPKFSFFGWYSYCIKMERCFSKSDLIAIPNAKDKYILIQRLQELVNASNYLLENTDYYLNCNKSQMADLERRRSLIV